MLKMYDYLSLGCSNSADGAVVSVELLKHMDQNDAEYPDKIYGKFDVNVGGGLGFGTLQQSASVLIERGSMMKSEEDVVRPTR